MIKHLQVQRLLDEFNNFEQIEAIALGGSRAGTLSDEKSDYDLYFYVTQTIPEEERTALLSRYCDTNRMEIGNRFWEYGDECVMNDGIIIDIMYRDLDSFAAEIASVAEQHNAHNNYTTCMWYNLEHCQILFDRTGRLTALQKKYDIPYPVELKKNIIERGMKLLRYGMPAFERQILKAVQRGDLVSVNHRTAEFFASYFDVLFAVNEQLHPGEKRLLQFCERNCALLPKNFRENIQELFGCMFTRPELISVKLEPIITELERITSTACDLSQGK